MQKLTWKGEKSTSYEHSEEVIPSAPGLNLLENNASPNTIQNNVVFYQIKTQAFIFTYKIVILL